MSKHSSRLTHLCLALAAASLALACASPIKTAFDTDPSANVSAYETYAWIEIDAGAPAADAHQGPYVSRLDDKRIRSAVDSQLQAKGYVAGGISRADLVVHFRVAELVAHGDLTPATTSLVIQGFLEDGCTNFLGEDAVTIVP